MKRFNDYFSMLEVKMNSPICFVCDCLYNIDDKCLSDLHNITPKNINCDKYIKVKTIKSKLEAKNGIQK